MLHEAYAEPAANPERSKGNAFRVHDVLQSEDKNAGWNANVRVYRDGLTLMFEGATFFTHSRTGAASEDNSIALALD